MKIFVLIIGAIVGSFLNVCIYRLPKGKSVIRPRSYCPICHKHLRWYDNIPVFSYLLLLGKCRFCRSKISFRYILVELLTAVSFLAIFMAFGLTPRSFAYALLTAGLIIATFVDFEIQEIPDQVTIFGAIAGLGLSIVYPSIFGETKLLASFSNSLLGAVAGGASIYLMGFLGELVFKKEAMGGGDVKLLAMIGSFLGWKLTLLTFFIAPLFGAIVGIILKVRYGHQTIPYGPYLSLGAMVSIFWGERILGLLFYGLY